MIRPAMILTLAIAFLETARIEATHDRFHAFGSGGSVLASQSHLSPRCAPSICSSAFASCCSVSSSLPSARFRNSPCNLEPLRVNQSSTATPPAIAASHKSELKMPRNESYGMWASARTISPATPATTTTPLPKAQFSADSDAISRCSSLLAFIVPFGRRQGGQSFRGFWVGLGIGAVLLLLEFAVLFVK